MLVDLSLILSMLHVIVLFLSLFEYRCSRRTFVIATSIGMAVLVVVNGLLIFVLGTAGVGRIGLLTCSLPSLLFFLILTKDRGARFFFTFCLVDTASLWVILLTGLIDYFVGGKGVVTFVLRMLAFPALEWAVWKYFRRPYLELLHTVRRGWTMFAVTTVLFYVLFAAISAWPIILFERPDDIPVALLVAALMPLTYATIFGICRQQIETAQASERRQVLEAQASVMERRAEDLRRAEERLRIERHDLRHRLQTVAMMISRDDKAAALDFIGASGAILDETKDAHYCRNVVLDAILSSYLEQAKRQGIEVETQLAIPDELPVDVAELSTVFANALENAIRACQELPKEQRRIICKCVTAPRFMFEIANPYAGEISIGTDGLPLSSRKDHGIGTRSITAFAEKHNAICRFRAEDGWFKVQVAL